MKTQGFTVYHGSLKEALSKKMSLPENLALWGDFQNFERLNFDHREINVFLLSYYNEIVAGITYYEKNLFGILKTGYAPHPNLSVPFSSFYIKAQDSQRAQEQLLEQFTKAFSKFIKGKFGYFNLIFPSSVLDIREFLWNDWEIQPRYTYVLDFKEIKKIGLSIYVGKKLRNIIKYVKEELIIKPITAKEFFACYEATYLRQNRPSPKPLSFFQKLYTLKNMVFFGAFNEGKLTSGVVVCEHENTAYFIAAGALDDHKNSNGVTFLLYAYIESLLENSEKTIQKFDFVGANEKNIAYFKSCFQPTLEFYFAAVKTTFMFSFLKTAMNIKVKLAQFLNRNIRIINAYKIIWQQKISIPYMIKQFIFHPILSSYIFIVNVYYKVVTKKVEKHLPTTRLLQ